MTDDDVTRRLEDALRAKAAQVPDPTGAFDPTSSVTEFGADTARTRGVWRYALVSAAMLALVAGVTAAVFAAGSDDSSKPAAPVASTTVAPTTADVPSTTAAATSTTLPPSTTTSLPPSTTTSLPTPTTSTPRPQPPPPWTDNPEAQPDGTIAVAGFNAYLDAYPSAAAPPKQLALTFTRLDPPLREPQLAVRVEEGARPDGQYQVVVFELQADDSVAESRYELLFAPHGDGTWRLASASRSYRCQPGRGHQDFSTELCV